MKKLLLFAAAATMFAACSKDTTQDLAIDRQIDKLYVSIGDDDSRVQLNNECKTVWNEGDMVSVFNKTTENECWQFDGKTGDKQGTLSRVSGNAGTTNMDKVIALYPYDPNCAVSGNMINTTIPATQTYRANSFGEGGNIMVAVSNVEDLQFKHIFGWIKLSLTDNLERSVESITFSGNNDEKLAGSTLIDTSTQKVYISGNTKSLTLDCGNGVQLSADTPTYFYIAVLPQTFTKGVSVTVRMTNGTSIKKHHEDSFTVTRNHIQPVKATNFQSVNDIIFYKTSDDKTVNMYTTEGFGANFVSNNYVNGQGIIQFDGNITSIPEKAFGNCKTLNSISIPDSVTAIGDYAFYNCSRLTSITIHDSVTTIGDSAFEGCSSLTSITIPDSVIAIGNSVFKWCSSLTSVNIPDSVRSIGNSVFYECLSLTSVNIPDSVWYITDYTFVNCRSLTSITIPDGVTAIGRSAFSNCSRLTNINIPDSVTAIGDSAFTCCSSLTSVNIGKSVTKIDNYTFMSCNSLTSITIPDSVTAIGNQAFSNCSSLTSITIPDSVTTIGYNAFYECSSLMFFLGKYTSSDLRCLIMDGKLIAFAPFGLTEYTIPNNVTAIRDHVFYSSSLTNITIPDSVTAIGDYAFLGCSSLTSVTIGKNVTKIGDSAFSGCSSLTSIYCKPTVPPTLETDIFYITPSSAKIYVPINSVSVYKVARYWNSYASKIVGYEF